MLRSTSTFDSPLAPLLSKESFHPKSRTSFSSSENEEADPYYLSNGKICSDNQLHRHTNIEQLAKRLFSVDHLKLILEHPQFFIQFRACLLKFHPRLAVTLRQYLDVQKALAAVRYANALAEHLWPGLEAAMIKEDFETRSIKALGQLLNEALPMFITYQATELVTDVLKREITGQSIPVLKDLVNGLAEVYCLSDPNQPDNPIVYASEEFYRTTLYSPADVIGKNCRFLQGAMTSSSSISRIVDALSEGKELCETILNYRHDGSPFLNLLVIAPLYDSTGKVRFFLGAQVDVNGLFENGRGLESLAQLLVRDQADTHPEEFQTSKSMDAFARLSHLLNDKERRILQNPRGDPTLHPSRPKTHRQLSVTELDYNVGKNEFEPSLGTAGPNGRLVGVFQNYMLVSPAPALRIVFASPSLSSPSLINTPLLSRIRGPHKLRQSIEAALIQGDCFTTKISWLTNLSVLSSISPVVEADGAGPDPHMCLERTRSSPQSDMESLQHMRAKLVRRSTNLHDRLTWIHCTPLLDGENRVGVWMVVMVKGEADPSSDGPASEVCFHRK